MSDNTYSLIFRLLLF